LRGDKEREKKEGEGEGQEEGKTVIGCSDVGGSGGAVREGVGGGEVAGGRRYCCYLLAAADGSKSYCGVTTDLHRRCVCVSE